MAITPCRYIIDANALINYERTIPRDIFTGFWEDLEELIRQEKLMSHAEVREELRRGSGDIYEWAKSAHLPFIPPDDIQLEWVARILEKFPDMANPSSLAPHADPWLVALALSGRNDRPLFPDVIVTDEKHVPRTPNAPKIPNVCHFFGIECINRWELIRREGWQYGRNNP